MKKSWLALPLSTALLFGSAVPTGTFLDNLTQSEAHAAKKKYYFKNNVAKITDVKIKITKVKVLKPGQGKNYSDNKVMAFYYTTTNLTGKTNITPAAAWTAIFDAYQSTSSYTANLDMFGTIDSKYTNSQYYSIKKGKSLKGVVSYELINNKSVTLKAHKGYDGNYLGKKTYKVKF